MQSGKAYILLNNLETIFYILFLVSHLSEMQIPSTIL